MTPSLCLYCKQQPADPNDDFCRNCNEFDDRPVGVIWAEQVEQWERDEEAWRERQKQ